MIIEQVLRDYLADRLTVPVVCERPENKPAKYVIISKTGSSRTDRLNSAHVVIQSNADSMYNVMTLNEQIKDILNADDIPNVNCSLEGDYIYTDTATKTYRYQCAYNVYYED